MPGVSSQIRIVNQALLLLGENLIQSLDEDTNEAKVADAFYEDARDHCLRDIKPSFAKRRATDLKESNVPSSGYDHAFDLPQDCLVVVAQIDPDQYGTYYRKWAVEGRQLLTNQGAPNISYVAMFADVEGMMDSSFIKALAAYLASELAYPLTNDTDKVSTMFALYEQRADAARAVYGLEQGIEVMENTELSQVR